MRTLIFAVLCSFCLTPPCVAATNFETGNDILRICTSTNYTETGECLGYLQGVADMQTMVRSVNNLPPCFPVGTQLGQIEDAVVAYLRANPADRTQEGASLVAHAIASAWGCLETPKKSSN